MRILKVAAVLLLAACSSNGDGNTAYDPAKNSDGEALTGTLPRHMRNCPSGVSSAKTVATRTVDGVDLTITSDVASAQQQILTLTRLQGAQGEPIWFLPEHSGMHAGPGGIGRCPIIHADTTMTYRELTNGVRIHIAARAPRDVAHLQQATEERVRALTMPSS